MLAQYRINQNISLANHLLSKVNCNALSFWGKQDICHMCLWSCVCLPTTLAELLLTYKSEPMHLLLAKLSQVFRLVSQIRPINLYALWIYSLLKASIYLVFLFFPVNSSDQYLIINSFYFPIRCQSDVQDSQDMAESWMESV